VAGTGVAGFSGDGGPALAATFNGTEGLAVDDSGNIYINDQLNYRIRKVNTAGIITTIAGTGTSGYSGDGGPATSAQFHSAQYLTTDNLGNLYFSQQVNTRVRKINKAGIVTTVVGNGSGTYSGDGGPAVAAGVFPYGLKIACNGDLYIAGNFRIRKVTHINAAPAFAHGTIQHKAICWNTTASIDTLLSVTDIDTAQKATWSTVIAPSHGTLTASFMAITSGSAITPFGLSYTPAIGYTGIDSFRVKIADCAGAVATTTIYMQVDSPAVAGTITGTDSLCPGDTTLLANSITTGTWSSSNTSLATVSSSGKVSALSSGSVTISYTVTNGCGSMSTVFPMIVNSSTACFSGVHPSHPTEFRLWPNPALNGSFSVYIPAVAADKATITITDITGRQIKNMTVATNTIAKVELNAPQGIYFISAATSEGVVYARLYR
jgi:uncharacterized protein YjdB